MEFIDAMRIIQPVNNKYSWFDTSFNMNIYRGCNQGCIYCDSRSACYNIENFEQIKVKTNAPFKIKNELTSKRKKGIIGLGSMSDPYNHFENESLFTRKVLKHINAYKYGVFVITKNNLVIRDIDIFRKINVHSVVNIGITITTYDDILQKQIEPNSSTTLERFEALHKMVENSIFCGILLMPVLPYINDTVENIVSIVEKAHNIGVNYIYPSFGVTLRDRQRDYFYKRIDPLLTVKYKNDFGESYFCKSPNADVLFDVFTKLCDKYEILYKMDDIIKAQRSYVKEQQISLF